MGKTHVSNRSESKNFDHTSGLGTRHDVVEGEGAGKTMTTDRNAFVRSFVDHPVVDVFDQQWICNALLSEGIEYVTQIPSSKAELVKIKGIGAKSADKILEVLNG